MKKNIKIYLTDIVRAAGDAETYTADLSKEEFVTERMVQDAVLYKLAVISEAAAKIPISTRRKYGAVPWKNIIGMRNVVVHDYSDINLNEIWNTVTKDLPELIQATQKILKELSV